MTVTTEVSRRPGQGPEIASGGRGRETRDEMNDSLVSVCWQSLEDLCSQNRLNYQRALIGIRWWWTDWSREIDESFHAPWTGIPSVRQRVPKWTHLGSCSFFPEDPNLLFTFCFVIHPLFATTCCG